MAIGLRGEPVPPGMGIGEAVIRNAQRLRFAAAAERASRSQLSKMGVPIAISRSWCIGCVTPDTPEGMTSVAASLPTMATSRSFSHLAHDAYNPAIRAGSQAPSIG